MSSAVKTIFKVLLGTAIIMVVIPILVEIFNMNVSGAQLRQMTKMSAKQSCELFTQESYKKVSTTGDTTETAGSYNMANINMPDGTLYLTGTFYTGTDAQSIWEEIYDTDDFLDFCTGSGDYDDMELPGSASSLKEVYYDINALHTALTTSDDAAPSAPTSWSSASEEYNKYTLGKTYIDNLVTTSNIGIPYLDKTVLNRIFKWNLTQLLSNCDNDSLQGDKTPYVNYKGFRCYTKQAQIYDLDYKCYNLADASDIAEFTADTGISTSYINYETRGISTTLNTKRLDNNYITVVNIKYKLPVTYQGITPIASIFNYIMNLDVAGYDGVVPAGTTDEAWNFNTVDLDNGVSGATSSLGKLTYVLIR